MEKCDQETVLKKGEVAVERRFHGICESHRRPNSENELLIGQWPKGKRYAFALKKECDVLPALKKGCNTLPPLKKGDRGGFYKKFNRSHAKPSPLYTSPVIPAGIAGIQATGTY
jgi:hypothetical protein